MEELKGEITPQQLSAKDEPISMEQPILTE